MVVLLPSYWRTLFRLTELPRKFFGGLSETCCDGPQPVRSVSGEIILKQDLIMVRPTHIWPYSPGLPNSLVLSYFLWSHYVQVRLLLLSPSGQGLSHGIIFLLVRIRLCTLILLGFLFCETLCSGLAFHVSSS